MAEVALLIPNLFVRVPVESAVQAAGAEPRAVPNVAAARASGCGVVVVDLDALGEDPATAVRTLTRAGRVVLAFGPHVQGERLAQVRAAGAVALPRSAFLPRLPELLEVALASARGAE
jgi:hypothetical protein